MIVLGNHDAALDDRAAAELWSASGARWLSDPALPVPGRLVRRVVGLVAELDGRGAHLADLVAAEGLGLLAERAALMGLRPGGAVSSGGASRFVECRDGWIVLSLARADDIGLVPAWLERDLDGLDVWSEVRQVAAASPAGLLVERAALLGLPCSVVGEVTDSRPAIADRIADAAPRTTSGSVVVDLAALWAGPLAGDVLARLGARLITVESVRRPDGGRRARRFFEVLHGRSESVALDLSAEHGRTTLRGLLECADVVIEGSRPRAIEQMGIDARELLASGRGPRVWLSITAHGRGEVARERVGFGDDAAAAGGLVGSVAGTPRFIADAVADPLTGLTAATAAAQLLERGGRWLVDVALARTARSASGEWLPAGSAAAERPRPRHDRGGSMPLGRDTEAVLRSLGVT